MASVQLANPPAPCTRNLPGAFHFMSTFRKLPLDKPSPVGYYHRNNTMNECQIRLIPEPCCSLAIAGAEQDRLVTMFKALGNPLRFEIMKFLVTHPGCITGDIVDYLPIAQATVSQHLKVLRDAGWIEGNVEGTAVSYCLSNANITWFREQIGDIF
jgi:ArsR family transcriptional regulator, arsenate/arsenite/antimonite-responsive transcriptional repressor